MSDERKCPSCGIPWTDHLGMTGTCAKLQITLSTLRVARTALATGKGDDAVVVSVVELIRKTLGEVDGKANG